MTSYVKKGPNIYNSVPAPPYNVLSYTWGNFIDSTATAITINGVNWPIPAIRREHFTPDTFNKTIEHVARGFKHPCEWIWVDVACIPQEHKDETKEARDIRGQEIGRQVGIFQHAKEAFAWLCHLNKSELFERQPHTTMLDFIECANQGVLVRSADAAARYLENCDKCLRLHETWMDKILSHPWLSSLWTLQEMVLRLDAMILLDDGLFDPYCGRPAADSKDEICWTFEHVINDLQLLEDNSRKDSHVRKDLGNAERIVTSEYAYQEYKNYALDILKRLERLLEIQRYKGLDYLLIGLPHTAYSAAQHRNVTKLVDRIFGIIQTYDICCNPDPPGDSEQAKLHALEDEFGKKLVAKSAVLSQLFIHSSTEPPRRSWLITQRCKVDKFWYRFSGQSAVVNQLCLLTVLEDCEDMKFDGKAWNLDSFTASIHKGLFGYTPSPGGSPQDGNLGLLLDYHVSKELIGRTIEYFESRETMLQAVKMLNEKYEGPVRIALLGSCSSDNKKEKIGVPVTDYVGIVLAPLGGIGRFKWARIGLYRWRESYYHSYPLPHEFLPAYQEFSAVII